MDNDVKIPNEYLEDTYNTDLEEDNIDGGDYNLNYAQNILDLDDSNEYKMPGEEESSISGSNVNYIDSKGTKPVQIDNTDEGAVAVSDGSSNLNSVNQDNEQLAPSNYDNQDNNFDVALEEIDSKIKDLEILLSSLSSNTGDNLLQNNTVNDNTLVNENNYKNDLNNIDKSTENFSDKNIVNTSQLNKVEQVKNIINEINELRNLKNFYVNNPENANILNKSLTNNLFKDEGQVVFDNFTPNLKVGDLEKDILETREKDIATKRAVETERSMGGDPEIVQLPNVGEVVIDKRTQKDVNDAINQHGGIENAINDSVINQKTLNEIKTINESNSKKDINLENYTPNFFNENEENVGTEFFTSTNSRIKNNNISNLIDGSESVSDNISNLFQNNSKVENLPNNNLNLIKNTKESLTILNKISKQLENISNSINKSFNNLGKSITNINNVQRSYSNVNQNSTNSNSNNVSAGGSKNSANEIPEVRGDFPLQDDFPKNFNTETLFSNIRP